MNCNRSYLLFEFEKAPNEEEDQLTKQLLEVQAENAKLTIERKKIKNRMATLEGDFFWFDENHTCEHESFLVQTRFWLVELWTVILIIIFIIWKNE